MFTVLLPPCVNPIAINKYITSYKKSNTLSPLIWYAIIPCVTFVPPCIFDHERNLGPNRKSVHKLPPFVEQHFPCYDHWLQLSAVTRAGSPLGLCWTASRLGCEQISGISARVCTWFVSIIITHLIPFWSLSLGASPKALSFTAAWSLVLYCPVEFSPDDQTSPADLDKHGNGM